MASADAPWITGTPAALEYVGIITSTYEAVLQDAASRCENQLSAMVMGATMMDEAWEGLEDYVGVFPDAQGDLAIGPTDERVAQIVRDTEYGLGPEPPAPLMRRTMAAALPILSRTFEATIEKAY